MNENVLPKKLLFISAGVLLVIILAVFVFYLFRDSAVLRIETEDGAVVFIRNSNQVDFEQVGVGSLTYETQSEGATYIRITKDDKTTESTTNLAIGQERSVTMPLLDTSEYTTVSPVPLKSVFESDGFLYGINPNTGGIAFFDTTLQQRSGQLYLAAPSLSQIFWESTRSFVYQSPLQGTGKYTNGQFEPTATFYDFGRSFIDVAVTDSGREVYLASDGIYVNNNKSLRKIASIDPTGSPRIAADDTSVYYVNTTYPEVEDEGDVVGPDQTTIIKYSYDGQTLYELSETDNATDVTDISVFDNQLLIAGSNKVLLIDNSGSITNFVGHYAASLFTAGSEGMFTGFNNGIWKYDPSANIYQLVAELPQEEQLFIDSIEYSQSSGSLYFSSQPSDENYIQSAELAESGTKKIDL